MIDAAAQAEEPEQVPLWLEATVADLEGIDLEAPIAGSRAADCRELADLYRSASVASSAEAGGTDAAARARVWNMLCGVTSMHFKPADPNEPFGPMLLFADGRRSAIAADFRGHVDVLQAMGRATSNVVLKARLCDLVWLLDRKQVAQGFEALRAYVDVARQIDAGELIFRGADGWKFHHETQEYLLRALGLARMLGWSKPEALAAQAQLVAVRKRAVAVRDPTAVYWFCELDLRTKVSDPDEIAAELEEVLQGLPADANHHVVVDLWRLAARAYQMAKREEDKHRCQIAVAEAMAAQAEKTSSAMIASQLIGNAIAALQGVASAKARRLDLRYRLVEVQARIDDEMSTYSQEIDLEELATKIRDGFAPLSVFDSLFLFAGLDVSPDPASVRAEAVDNIRKYPLSSLFGAAHLDDEGKVVARTAGGGGFGEPNDTVVTQQIAQGESIRRHLVALGKIEVARQAVTAQHYLGDDVFYTLAAQSPFVPPDLAQTFARGFTRFFQGDLTSALYILTPLLENSLRHVLKTAGHDVTTFDSANQTQQDRTITALFDGMRVELDAVFTRQITEDIERLFLMRPGPAVRHGVAHGLLHDGSPYGADSIYGCWLIFRLCLLPLYPHRKALGLL